VVPGWWIRKPPWFSPAGAMANGIGHNNAVPSQEIIESGLGWPADVSRETFAENNANHDKSSGLGWPE